MYSVISIILKKHAAIFQNTVFLAIVSGWWDYDWIYFLPCDLKYLLNK